VPLADRIAAYPRTFWVLWVGTLVNRLGLVVLPFLTLYLTKQRGLSAAEAGGVLALYGVGALLASFTGGALADRLGRRPTILFSLFGGAAIVASVPMIEETAALAALVAALGFVAEMYRPAVSAAVSDLMEPARRARAFALLYWVINLGASVGPALGGLLATRGYELLFWLDAGTMAIYGVIVAVGMSETRPPETLRRDDAPPPPRLTAALRDPALLGLAGCALLIATLFCQAFTTLPLAMQADGLSEVDYGLAEGFNGVLIVLVSLFVTRHVEGRPPFKALAAAAAVIGLGFAAMAPAHTLPVYLAAIAVWTVGEMMNAPVAPALVARLAPVAVRGAYQGVYGAAWGMGFLLGPALGGLVLDRLGPEALWLGCGAVGFIAAIGYLVLHERTQERLAEG